MQTLHRNESLESRFPPPPADAEQLDFEVDGLHDVRSLVALAGSAAGLTRGRSGDLIVAASELAANSVRHAGGHGTARVWIDGGAIAVEVRDAGVIENPERLDRRPPAPTAEGGRGLWIANQLCDEVAIRSGVDGTRVRLRMALDPS
jgi:anti-sigma regulatory factor (Ser/Thr protein kinase)